MKQQNLIASTPIMAKRLRETEFPPFFGQLGVNILRITDDA